jgi:leucyl aminopeptidase (aminopeptidase T)
LQSDIDSSARIVIRKCCNIVSGETVAVITDYAQDQRLLDALSLATKDVGAVPAILAYDHTEKKSNPPKELVDKLTDYDVILLFTTVPFNYESLYLAQKKGARIITASRVTLDSFLRIVPIDYEALSAEMHRVGTVIENSSKVRIVTPNGTNFSAKIAPWGMRYATSVVRKNGDWAYLPAGTTGIGLVDGSAEGTFVADGIIVDVGRTSPPITLVVKNGLVVETHCSDKEKLDIVDKWLAKDEGANAVVEIGIGFNPKATLVSEPEGERVLGSVHIGTGDNLSFGGTIKSQSHLDIVILNSSLYSDGRELVSHGKIVKS